MKNSCRFPRRISAAMLTTVALLWMPLAGCGYPRIDREAFELAKAVSNLCNRRDADRLPMARAQIDAACERGDISDAEHRYLIQIVVLAEQGRWERAERQSLRLLSDQSDW
jgi:hypothetical protein